MMMKFVCWARVSQALLLTTHTSDLANKMHLSRACVSLTFLCVANQSKRYIHSGGIHSLRSTSQRSYRSGPNTEWFSVLLGIAMGDEITQT